MAQAQSVADVGGPRELPPGSFKGQQYVDSRGCVFLRAGYGGQVNWVPRVNASRKALCGFPPSFGPQPVIEMAEDEPVVVTPPVVVSAAARTTSRPIDTVASTTTPPRIVYGGAVTTPRVVVPTYAAPKPAAQPAPYRDTRPAGSYVAVAPGGPQQGKIGCYASAPVAERVRLQSGGTAVVCTRGDGGVSGWRPPIYPNGAGVGAALTPAPGPSQGSTRVARGGVSYGAVVASGAVQTPPAGYVLAWDDDRLNPNRGKGTAAGQAAQDQIWTRTVPAELVADVAAKKARKAAPQVTVSTKSAATAPTPRAGGGVLVQVGTFGVPANAAGAAQRLSGLGLPTAKSQITKGGKALQIVYAGPFASVAEASAALSAARGAGFADAFIR